MKAKGQYNTNQRKELQSYLETIAGEHTTVAEICGHFSALDKSIGTSTVYRQLERMVDEGLVEKYIVDASSPACFVYVGEHMHAHNRRHYHCKCEKCGELFHITCDALDSLEEHLLADHNFVFDNMRTVFYGICGNCRN